MVEGQLRELDLLRAVVGKFAPHDGLFQAGEVRVVVHVAGHHDALDRRHPVGQLGHPAQAVVDLAVVLVGGGDEQHLRLDLAEAVHHALHAEIGRAGGENRPDRGRRQHGNDRLGQVGQVGGHPVALFHAHLAQCRGHAGHFGVELGVADLAVHAVLVGEHQRGALVAVLEQVLGEIKPRLGEPTRARHGRPVLDGVVAAGLGDHVAELPHRLPEVLGVVHGPAIQRVPVVHVGIELLVDQLDEAGQVGPRTTLGRRPPQGFGHGSGCNPLEIQPQRVPNSAGRRHLYFGSSPHLGGDLA